MSQATGSRAQLGYIAETVVGTTPVTPQMKGVAFTDLSLELTKGLMSDNSLRADRQKRFSRHGNKSVGGSLKVNYALNEYDEFLAAAFYSVWSTNVLKIGNTETSFSLEHGQSDIGQYRQFTGVHFDGVDLTVPSGNQVVTASFAALGMNGAISATSLDANGLDNPVSNTYGDPLVHLEATFKLGGTSIGYMTGITVKVAQAAQANYALGSAAARSITPGMVSVSGQVTAYFETAALATLFISETNSSLEFTLNSGASSQTWLMSVVQFNGATIPVSSDGPLIVTLPYEALYDSVSGSMIQITRVV